MPIEKPGLEVELEQLTDVQGASISSLQQAGRHGCTDYRGGCLSRRNAGSEQNYRFCPDAIGITGSPTNIDPHISAVSPPQGVHCMVERTDTRLSLRIILGGRAIPLPVVSSRSNLASYSITSSAQASSRY
jgi:hypothetical protein